MGQPGAHGQILGHCQFGENLPPLRHMAHPQGGDPVRTQPGDIGPVQHHAPGGRAHQAGQGAQDGGFAGAIGPDQADHLPFLNAQIDPLDRRRRPIGDRQVLDRKQAHDGALCARAASRAATL